MGKRRVVLSLVLSLIIAGACSSERSGTPARVGFGDHAITVGSFDFVESHLLAEIYSQAMEARAFDVRRAFDLGPREFVAPALTTGLVDFLPEYAGTALQFATLGKRTADARAAQTHDALRRILSSKDVSVLDAAEAQDANAFVVQRELAERYDLHNISDLAAVAPRLSFGGPPECESRTLCLAGLKDTYGVEFKSFVELDAGGPRTHAAVDSGAVDVALLFTTDAALARGDLVELRDDRALQPSENITPLIRTSVLERTGPALAAAVDEVSSRLTTDALRNLNAQVGGDSARAAAVAARWLEREGLA